MIVKIFNILVETGVIYVLLVVAFLIGSRICWGCWISGLINIYTDYQKRKYLIDQFNKRVKLVPYEWRKDYKHPDHINTYRLRISKYSYVEISNIHPVPIITEYRIFGNVTIIDHTVKISFKTYESLYNHFKYYK